MRRMEQASASLFVNYDKGSTFSRHTDNLSKLSCIFDFDSELLSSAAYERVSRLTMKYVLRWPRISAREQTPGRPTIHFREYPAHKSEATRQVKEQQPTFSKHRNWSTEAVCCDDDGHIGVSPGLIVASDLPKCSPDTSPRNNTQQEYINAPKPSHHVVTWKSHVPILSIVIPEQGAVETDSKAIPKRYELDAVETGITIAYELDSVETEARPRYELDAVKTERVRSTAAVEQRGVEARTIALWLVDQLVSLKWQRNSLKLQQARHHSQSWRTNNCW